jgi:nucleotide-binding universal stress UspA family protein
MAPIEILLSVGFVVFGAIWYFAYAKGQAESTSLVGEAIAPVSAGPTGSENVYRIVVPIANPETQQDLLRLAGVSARTHTEAGTAELVAVNVIEVPAQTSLEQNIRFEEERVERQRELLESARDVAADMDVNFRTRAIVGRNAGQAILTAVEDEEADQVLLGWQGIRSRREYVFGSTLDPILQSAPCDVSLVKLEERDIGRPVVLAGPGPHTPVATRRAAEFATIDDTRPTLLNVQRPAGEDDDHDPVERGEAMIEDVAAAAGLESGSYDGEVLIADDIGSAILDAVAEYDTVCVGVSEKSTMARLVYGSIAQRVSQQSESNLVMVRGPYESYRSVREALAERLLR